MRRDVVKFCKSCPICQRTVGKGRVARAPLQNILNIDMPFKRVAVDLIGPIHSPSESGHCYVLTLVHYASVKPLLHGLTI